MTRAALLLVVLAACGDDGPSGPQTLTPDPDVALGCAAGGVGAGETRAKVVACTDELIKGRLASGRIGDLVIENAKVRVIVRGPGEGYYLHGSSGGGIVDAAVIGGEDLVKELLPSLELAVGTSDELVITEAGNDGPAEIVVRGPMQSLEIISAALGREPPPLILEHHYRLAADATELELETRVFAQPGAGDVEAPTLYEAMFLGGRASVSVVSGVIVATGTTTSYGLAYPADSADPQLVDIGGIRLVVGPAIDLGKSQKRWLVLGDGSGSSVMDRAFALRNTPTGTLTGTSAPNLDIEIEPVTGAATIARTDASGSFSAQLPQGDYMVRAIGRGRAPSPPMPAEITAGGHKQLVVPPGQSGTLAVTVKDDTNAPIPARVKFERAGVDERIEWVGASGTAMIPLEPGSWRVSISRGLEYDAFVATAVSIADGQTTPVSATLAHLLDTSGWISVDTHLHSELSTDSTFPVDDRLRAVAAEGVEVPVSTDHDMIVDYAPIITEIGLSDWLTPMIGAETSSLVWGHLNGFPLKVEPAKTGAGAAHWLAKSPGEVFAAMRGGDPSRVVQVNHPRLGGASLFDVIDLDPSTLHARRDPTAIGLPASADLSDLRFDAVEVANGLGDSELEEVLLDYLAMVAAGHPAAATGSSDSHGPTAFAGESRTFVWVGAGADDPATVDPAAIVAGIKARHVVVGSGSFVTAGIVTTSGTTLPGDTANITGATVTLHIKVQAAGWQPLSKIRIYQGKTELPSISLNPQDTQTLRYDADVVLPAPATDTFYLVRVDRAGPGDPVVDKALPAFTNPLFVNVP